MITVDVEQRLAEKLLAVISREQFIREKSSCLLAVSGGLDSVVLLHLFSKLAVELKLQLGIVHVHHGIRGKEADEDLEFVRALAQKYALQFYAERVDVPAHAREKKVSLEDGARTLRYRFFEAILAKTRFDVLATAHHKNDQAETVIDHFLRGSGSAGLRGMLPKRNHFIRPLLDFTRAELHDYALSCELKFRVDSTNQDLRFRRNRIRRELLPYLQDNFNPNIIDTLFRMSVIFKETESFIDSCAKDAYKSLVSLQEKNEIILDIEGFLGYNIFIQKQILFYCCRCFGLKPDVLSFSLLEDIVNLVQRRVPGKKILLNHTHCVMVDHDGLVIGKSKINKLPRVEIDLMQGNRFKYEGCVLRWEVQSAADIPADAKGRFIEYLDFNKTGRFLTLKGFYSGSTFYPLNLKGKKKVSDFFTDRKVPLRKRARVPIIESPEGIVWICGYRIDDRFKVTPRTSKILRLSMENFPA